MIISIANQKGGAGKTTTTKNLAKCLSNLGRKVLVVDFDPQFSLSASLGFDNTENSNCTIADLMKAAYAHEALPDKSNAVVSADGFDIILGSLALSAIEMSILSDLDREYFLDSILSEYVKDYDYILVDCNPSLSVLVINALVASDSVIIPVDSNYLAAKGLEQFLRTIIQITKRKNPRLDISGILLTKYSDRINISRSILDAITGAYGNAVRIFNTKIPASVVAGEADEKGVSIYTHKKNSKISAAYTDFATEVLNIWEN